MDSTGDRILHYVRRHITEKRYAPSYREIMTACKLSSLSQVNYWLRALSDQQKIIWFEGVSRGIALPERRPDES